VLVAGREGDQLFFIRKKGKRRKRTRPLHRNPLVVNRNKLALTHTELTVSLDVLHTNIDVSSLPSVRKKERERNEQRTVTSTILTPSASVPGSFSSKYAFAQGSTPLVRQSMHRKEGCEGEKDLTESACAVRRGRKRRGRTPVLDSRTEVGHFVRERRRGRKR
jgi:hypothetical protein